MLSTSNKDYKIELKFNCQEISQAPQFVSPMKPSQYLSNSYEEFYYHQYLPKLLSSLPDNPDPPPLDTYLKEIHSISPKCMVQYQELYKRGIKSPETDQIASNFCQLAKELDKKSRSEFIKQNDLDLKLLSDYLTKSQKDKYYMLYQNGKFHLDQPNPDDYQLLSYRKEPEKYRYICQSQSGKTINVLLRWKNGIAYPAFQISLNRDKSAK